MCFYLNRVFFVTCIVYTLLIYILWILLLYCDQNVLWHNRTVSDTPMVYMHLWIIYYITSLDYIWTSRFSFIFHWSRWIKSCAQISWALPRNSKLTSRNALMAQELNGINQLFQNLMAFPRHTIIPQLTGETCSSPSNYQSSLRLQSKEGQPTPPLRVHDDKICWGGFGSGPPIRTTGPSLPRPSPVEGLQSLLGVFQLISWSLGNTIKLITNCVPWGHEWRQNLTYQSVSRHQTVDKAFYILSINSDQKQKNVQRNTKAKDIFIHLLSRNVLLFLSAMICTTECHSHWFTSLSSDWFLM